MIVATCSCYIPTTGWTTVSGSTVEQMVRHWMAGHIVTAKAQYRPQISAIATILAMTGWKPIADVDTKAKRITPAALLKRAGAMYMDSTLCYLLKGKIIYVEWLDNQTDQYLTEYFREYLTVDEVIRR